MRLLSYYLQAKMIHKRPYVDDSQEVACKLPRLWEDAVDLAPDPQISGKREDIYSICQDKGSFAEDQWNKVLNGTSNEYESSTSGCVSHFWWVNSTGIDANADQEVAVHLPLFPEYFASGRQIQDLLHSNEIYQSILSPRMLVSVGPEHQADIPEWSQQDQKNSTDFLDTSDPQVALRSSCAGLMVNDDYGDKMIGYCVIPMPDSEATAKFQCEDSGRRTECECLDQGSVRCVRQHVMEVREKLRENLGQEIFREMGLCDMGEEVAKRWTEEEELAFHNVVLSNPVSMGKNFWDHLSAVIPSRAKEDFIRYYFNVFMLRKRAQQNRIDPVNVDSDDDEWQTIEYENQAEDDNSAVESPVGQGTAAHFGHCHEEDGHVDIEDDNEDGVDSSENVAGDICRAAINEEDKGESFISDYNSNDFQLSSKIQGNNEDDYDIQDDSCTLYEYQREEVECCGLHEAVMDENQPSQE
ncbi:uncharacterized protein LOC120118606 isoform X1 [Hibiscus syriacus]|uniref:uncharacterized protein LOC120118606 isoform X1 n=2 Tax=Hibiscus syriacus TaxID=106335 RepID=UPI001923FBF9|nr:uncharacterized protein LOC120118606 isoform X1 [Hibiscus syriacus]